MTHLSDGTYMVIPDLQVPLHDQDAVAAVLTYAADLEPDAILCVGDEADAWEISRWTRGMTEEYMPTLEANLIATHDVIAGFAAIAPMHVMRSNHTSTRLERYLRYAPALLGLSFLTYPQLMGFDGHKPLLTGRDEPLAVTWHDKMWEFADGWVLAHGDEGSLSRVPGSTAMSLARQIGASVVCGHTHRAGIQHHTEGFSGQIGRELYGLEVGHLMDVTKVSYLKTGLGNWKQAFGVLRIHNGVVYPELVLLGRDGFMAQGDVWERS